MALATKAGAAASAQDIEKRFGVRISVAADGTSVGVTFAAPLVEKVKPDKDGILKTSERDVYAALYKEIEALGYTYEGANVAIRPLAFGDGLKFTTYGAKFLRNDIVEARERTRQEAETARLAEEKRLEPVIRELKEKCGAEVYVASGSSIAVTKWGNLEKNGQVIISKKGAVAKEAVEALSERTWREVVGILEREGYEQADDGVHLLPHGLLRKGQIALAFNTRFVKKGSDEGKDAGAQ